MPTNSYDLIVLGDDTAGLVAAALCARRGMRTLLLTHGERPPRYAIGQFRLPIEPLTLPGRASAAARRVIDELHLDHAIKRRLQAGKQGFQVVTPTARLDLGPEAPPLDRELARELDLGAEEATAAAALLDQVGPIAGHFDAVLGQDVDFPPTGFWQRREVGRSSSRVEDDAVAWRNRLTDPTLAAATMLPSVLATWTAADDLSAPAQARNFHLLRQGAARLRGDFEGLRELFLEKLTGHGGEVRTARAAALQYSWGKIASVRLENGEELGAGQVIAALSADALWPLVGDKQPKRLRECMEAIRPSGYRYTLNLVVDDAGIPEGMAPLVFAVVDPAKPLTGDNAFAIHLAEPDDGGRVVVTVTATVPAPDGDAPASCAELARPFAMLRQALGDRIEMVMPFLGNHLLVAHSPDEATAPEGGMAEPPKGLLPVDLLAPRALWRSSMDAAMGVSAAPYTVGVKNLTLASTQVLPQLGLEGELTVGWCAARIACGIAGKKRDYLKDEVLSSQQ
jgi:hypothetical protein